MAFKIGNVALSDIVVNDENGNPIDIREVNVKKNNVTTKVWGKRSVTVTVNNYSYISSISYSYKDAGGYTKSGTISSTTTFSDVSYDENFTISATAKSRTIQYVYSVSGGGTYNPNISSITITGSRSTRYYTVNLTGNYTHWCYYEDSDRIEVDSAYVPYGTTVTKYNDTAIEINGTIYYAEAPNQTAQYTYTVGTISTVLPITLNTGYDATVNCDTTRSIRKYDVTVGCKYGNNTIITSTTVNIEYGTTVNSSTYYGSTYSHTENKITYNFSGLTSSSITVTGSGQSVYSKYSSVNYKIGIDFDNIDSTKTGYIYCRIRRTGSTNLTQWKRSASGFLGYTGYDYPSGYASDMANGRIWFEWFLAGKVYGSYIYYYSGPVNPVTVYLSSSTANSYVVRDLTNDITYSSYYLGTAGASNKQFISTSETTISTTAGDLRLRQTITRSGVSTSNCLNKFNKLNYSRTVSPSWIHSSLFGDSNSAFSIYDICSEEFKTVYEDIHTYSHVTAYEVLTTDTTLTYLPITGSNLTTAGNCHGFHLKVEPTEYYDPDEETYEYYGHSYEIYCVWHNASVYNTRIISAGNSTNYASQGSSAAFYFYTLISSDD